MIVGEHGDIRPLQPHKQYDGPRWHSIEFEPDEIKRECPKAPPPSAKNWLLKEAERLHGKGKRDSMVHDCMAATNCSRREALAAYKELPNGLRRPRGKPSKNFG